MIDRERSRVRGVIAEDAEVDVGILWCPLSVGGGECTDDSGVPSRSTP